MRSQEAPCQAISSGADQGNHTEGQFARAFPGKHLSVNSPYFQTAKKWLMYLKEGMKTEFKIVRFYAIF